MTGVVADFEDALGRGRFMRPVCHTCCRTVWPPSEFCSVCLGKVSLGDDHTRVLRGIILECSRNYMTNSCCGNCGGDATTADSPHRTGNDTDGGNRSEFFCLVEFEPDVRIVAGLASGIEPRPGDSVVLKSCGLANDNNNDTHYTFEVSLAYEA